MGNVQHLAHVAPLSSSYAQNTIPEWRKSRWCVSKEYDRMIIDSVNNGYESYDDLPDDLRFNLVMEIIKTERNAVFIDNEDYFEIIDRLIQILISKASKESHDALDEYLLNDFISNEHFIADINTAIEDQINTKKGGVAHA